MKRIMILRMRPGVDVQESAFQQFLTHGPAKDTEWLIASIDSRTYVSLQSGDPDLESLARYAPFFDVETLPVVDVDEAWIETMRTAIDSRV